jgi:hypothetical protein
MSYAGGLMKYDKISAIRIDVAPEVFSDLRQRLKNTRWSYQVENANWDAGTDLHYLRELVAYWQDACDWRKHETALNQFAQFKIEVDDIGNRDRPVSRGLIPAWDSHRRQL